MRTGHCFHGWMSELEPILQGQGSRLECNVRPRDCARIPSADIKALRGRSHLPADYPRFPARHHDGGLRSAVDADDVGWLNDQARLFARLARRAFLRGLVDFQEAPRLRPLSVTGLDGAANQYDIAVGRYWQGAHDRSRIDVRDEAARRTYEPVPRLSLDRPIHQWLATARAVVQVGGEPVRHAR